MHTTVPYNFKETFTKAEMHLNNNVVFHLGASWKTNKFNSVKYRLPCRFTISISNVEYEC